MAAFGPSVLSAVFCLGAALMLAGCSGSVPDTEVYPTASDFEIHGIDVSRYQGDIDWNSVRDSGVRFAWIKATEGGDRADERFQANWTGAKQAGIPRGAYHFVYWCRAPMEEMANFEQTAPVEPDALPPVLDVEATPTSPTCHRHLTEASATADMQVMLDEMERHYGKRPIIYTTVDFYRAILSDGAFSNYPIWVRSTKYHPSVKYGGRAWRLWQYQSDARVPGIGTKVDKDAFYGDNRQWEAFLKNPNVQPAAAPAPQPAEAPAAAPSVQSAAVEPASVQPVSAQAAEAAAGQTAGSEPAEGQ